MNKLFNLRCTCSFEVTLASSTLSVVTNRTGISENMTNAAFPEKNETNCEHLTDDITGNRCGCNNTLNIVEEDQIQTKIGNKTLDTNSIDEDNILACTEVQTETQYNTDRTPTDTLVDKIVFDATNKPDNVLLRRKRSSLNHRNLRYAANVPLIRYRVPDNPRHESIVKDATNVVNTAALADFHIETLHPPGVGVSQPIVRNPQIFRNPPEHLPTKYKTPTYTEEINESDDYLAKTISKPFVAIPDSHERNDNVKSRGSGKPEVKPVYDDNRGLIYNNGNTTLKNDDDDTAIKIHNENKVQESDEIGDPKYIISSNKIYKARDSESIETDEEEDNNDEASDTSAETEENSNSNRDERNSDETDEENEGSKETAENDSPDERGGKDEISRYLEQNIDDKPYQNINKPEELKDLQKHIKKLPYVEKYRKDKYAQKIYPKNPLRGSTTQNQKDNYKHSKHDQSNVESDDQSSVESDENQSKPVAVTEDSRENIGDDVPEHRSLSDTESGEKNNPVQDITVPKETDYRGYDHSEEVDYPTPPYRGNKESYTDSKSRRPLPRDDSSESEEQTTKRPIHNTWYPKKQYAYMSTTYKERSPKSSRVTEAVSTGSEDDDKDNDEAIVFVMNKNRKPNRKIHDEYDIEKPPQKLLDNIRDVDLRNFDHERIKLNHKGKVRPLHYKKHGVKNEKIIASERKFDDVDVRPVVEIKREHDKTGKKSVKYNENDEDASLETVLGVKSYDETELPENSTPDDERRDVKQEFERIPTNNSNNNHKINTEQSNDEKEPNAPESTTEYDIDATLTKLGLLKPIEPVRYDENLNIKFDDEPIRLPEIKLPEDVLTYTYPEPEYKDSSYKKHKNSDQIERAPNSYNSEEEQENRSVRKESKEDVSHDEDKDRYYGHNSHKNSDIKRKTSEEDGGKELDDDDDEEEDLYEKFVRERFGKRGSFHKRSEKLLEGRQATPPLYDKLHDVLKKTDNIEKEAAASGDPDAGYMWTLEYGRNL